jgi:hypothetical protein
MATYIFTKDGKDIEVDVPEGMTPEQAWKDVEAHLGGQQPQPQGPVMGVLQQGVANKKPVVDSMFGNEYKGLGEAGNTAAQFTFPIAGGIAGAAAGAKLGFGLAPPNPYAKGAGALVGATAGTFLGETGMQLLADKLTKGEVTEKDLDAAMESAGESAAWTAGLGVAFPLASKAYSAGKSLYIKGVGMLSPELVAKEGLENLPALQAQQKLAQKYDATLMTHWATNSPLDKAAANLSVVGYGGKGKVEQNLANIETALNSEIDDLINAGRRSDFKGGFDETFEHIMDKTKTAASARYTELANKTTQLGVDANVSMLSGYVDKLSKQMKASKNIENPVISDVVSQYQSRVGSAKTMTPAELDKWRQDIRLAQRNATATPEKKLTPEDSKVLDDMVDAIDNTLEAAVRKSGKPELMDEYLEAKKVWAEFKGIETGSGQYGKQVVTKLWQNPDRLAGMLFNKGSQLEVREVMDALNFAKKLDPNFNTKAAVYNLRSSYLENVLGSGERTIADVHKFEKSLQNPEVAKTFNAIFSGGGQAYLDRLKTVLSLAKTTTEGAPKGMMNLVVSGRQATAVSSVPDTPTQAAINTIFAVLPRAAVHFAQNPDKMNTMLRLQKAAKNAPVGSFAAKSALSQLATLVDEMAFTEYQEKQ